ncbi:MAG: peptide chain release factor N(5)-glutamine methyltransferase [Phycisphaerales bacterium]|nr:peptide chain release factor N(5)-glutamine methyltransferase [Phycisphaerales bacterium]
MPPRPSAPPEPWTTRRLLKWLTDHFTAKSIDSPRVVAEMLLAHVLNCERLRLYMETDRPASPAELATLRELAARAANHEPVQYLVGHTWFFGRQFQVNRSTLIPRPCTETLVEHIIHWLRLSFRGPGHAPGIPGNPLIADIGTGTGCIAISLAAQVPSARIIATDISQQALELARSNAQRHNVIDRIDFRLGDGLAPLRDGIPGIPGVPADGIPGERFDVICSNPPYISDAEWPDVPANVKDYEPASALRGGPDGLDIIRPLIAHAPDLLAPGGLLAIEIAHTQYRPAPALAAANAQLRNATVLKDHENLWRVLVAERIE